MASIYVAGSSNEIERVEGVIAALREAGFTVPHDWTVKVREQRAPGMTTDAAMTDAEQEAAAEWCTEAVSGASVVLWLVSERPSHGAAWEACIAHDSALCFVASGPAARNTIFASLAERRFAADADAVAWLVAEGWHR